MGKKDEFKEPIVKKYVVEVLNKSSEPATIILGNFGHSLETVIPAKAHNAKCWEIDFTDAPDIRIECVAGKKSFGLRERHALTNSFVIEDDTIGCKNPNPLPPRKTTASPEIYGNKPQAQTEIVKNGSRTEVNFWIGDDWHNITGTLESGNKLVWKLVTIKVAQMITHNWCKIDELGSRRNKFTICGLKEPEDPEETDPKILDYINHKFEVNDNLELLRDDKSWRLWKWDYE